MDFLAYLYSRNTEEFKWSVKKVLDPFFWPLFPSEGVKQYTKNRGITYEEFDIVRKWWENRKSNGDAWKVSIKQIQERNYNLDFKNPNRGAKIEHKNLADIVKEIKKKEEKITEIQKEIKKQI